MVFNVKKKKKQNESLKDTFRFKLETIVSYAETNNCIKRKHSFFTK